MKVLIKGRTGDKPAPKRKIRWCSVCKSLLLIERKDCYKSETIIGELAWGAKCPICNNAIKVGKR